jgi:hypothetical protein
MHGKHVYLIPFLGLELPIEVISNMICYPGVGKANREVKNLCHPKATESIANVRKAYVGNPFDDPVIHLRSSEQSTSGEETNLQFPPGASLKILNEFLTDFGLSGRNGEVIAEFQFCCSKDN